MMKALLIAALLGMVSAPAAGRTGAADGTLLSSQPCPPNPIRNYADYVASKQAIVAEEVQAAAEEKITMPALTPERVKVSLLPQAEAEERLAYRGFECRVITYASGGLRIAGLLWKPLDTSGPKRPLLIMLRGGNNKFGAMEPWRYWGMHDFLKAGYVVLASQYRGGPGSDGTDGFGSPGDLDDVRNLVPLARGLGYVDTDRLFAHGGSRGGMQLYMLSRSGLPLKAMAIRAGAADLRAGWVRRPGLRVQTTMMTDYAADPEAAIDRRSAVKWADRIKTPTILFHGTDDWRVDVSDAIKVADGLRRARTPFEAHLYDGDTHEILLAQDEMIARTIDFFHRYGGPPRR